MYLSRESSDARPGEAVGTIVPACRRHAYPLSGARCPIGAVGDALLSPAGCLLTGDERVRRQSLRHHLRRIGAVAAGVFASWCTCARQLARLGRQQQLTVPRPSRGRSFRPSASRREPYGRAMSQSTSEPEACEQEATMGQRSAAHAQSSVPWQAGGAGRHPYAEAEDEQQGPMGSVPLGHPPPSSGETQRCPVTMTQV
jgi:hypothetical protein